MALAAVLRLAWNAKIFASEAFSAKRAQKVRIRALKPHQLLLSTISIAVHFILEIDKTRRRK